MPITKPNDSIQIAIKFVAAEETFSNSNDGIYRVFADGFNADSPFSSNTFRRYIGFHAATMLYDVQDLREYIRTNKIYTPLPMPMSCRQWVGFNLYNDSSEQTLNDWCAWYDKIDNFSQWIPNDAINVITLNPPAQEIALRQLHSGFVIRDILMSYIAATAVFDKFHEALKMSKWAKHFQAFVWPNLVLKDQLLATLQPIEIRNGEDDKRFLQRRRNALKVLTNKTLSDLLRTKSADVLTTEFRNFFRAFPLEDRKQKVLEQVKTTELFTDSLVFD